MVQYLLSGRGDRGGSQRVERGHGALGQVATVGDLPLVVMMTLLAMKMRASRARDNDDIGFLLSACGVRTVAQAQGIHERYHHQEVLSPVAQARVEHWLENTAD